MHRRKEISFAIRAQAIGMHRGGNSLQNISTALSLPRSTAQSIVNRWKNNNCIANTFRSGRPKLLNPRGMRKLKKIVKSSRWNTITKITSELQTSIQSNISSTTVRRRLHQLGFSARFPARKPLISESNPLRRYYFVQKYKRWSPDMWKSVIWSDECRFKLFHSDGRIRVWRQKNERFLNECIKTTVNGKVGP